MDCLIAIHWVGSTGGYRDTVDDSIKCQAGTFVVFTQGERIHPGF